MVISTEDLGRGFILVSANFSTVKLLFWLKISHQPQSIFHQQSDLVINMYCAYFCYVWKSSISLRLIFVLKCVFFQGASSLRRSEGGPRPNCLRTLSTHGAGKGLFRPCMHPAWHCLKVLSLGKNWHKILAQCPREHVLH